MTATTTTPTPISPNTRDYDRGYSDGYWDRPMPTRRSLAYMNGYSDGLADSLPDLTQPLDDPDWLDESEIPF